MVESGASLFRLRDESLARARDRWYERLRNPLKPVYVQGIWGVGEANPFTEPGLWVHQALTFLATQSDSLLDDRTFRPLCLEFGFYGVHFVDRIFGARVYQTAGQWWSDPLNQPVGRLIHPDLDADETVQQADRLLEAFLSADVSVPVFGLPTIASALNVAVNLYGEEFLAALVLSPTAAGRDLVVINDTLIELHNRYRGRLPAGQLQPVVAAERIQPPGCGQLCGCSTQLLSAAMYRDLVAPLDDALLAAYPNGGMIHLCGDHTRHLPVWRAMRSLRAVQLNDRAAEDLEAWFVGLREDQIIYLNPCPSMTLDSALDITGGQRLVVVGNNPKETER